MAERNSVTIGDRVIGDSHPTCVVAELGVNHLGDFERMKDMIHAAHEAGADLLKFQTYIAEERYDPVNNPKGQGFIDLLAQWQFTRDQEAQLWDYAASMGAKVFTSAFDPDSVKFADGLGSLAFKVAAFEVINLKLIRAIAETGKPVVLSRGMASDEEIQRMLNILEEASTPYIILHTISSYPLEKRFSNLRVIHSLREKYNCPIGHSDHTHGVEMPPLAVAAGATMIEKHFTVAPKLRQSDNFFSVTAEELRDIKFRVAQVDSYMGKDIVRIDTEDYMWDFRRHTD